MSRAGRCLLLVYPPAWRARYGRELLAVIEADSGRGRMPLRVVVDVIGSGLSQRLRSSGLRGDDLPAESGVKAGLLLVLCSWSVFVIAGIGLQKTSEHWQAVIPNPEQGLPAAAFGAVVVAAAIGSALVLFGILLTAGPLIGFLHSGGWQQIRRPVIRAICLTAVSAVVVVAVAGWAHRLTNTQRNGGDLLYTVAFLLLAAGAVCTIAGWTHAAVSTGRQLALNQNALRLETWVAAATTLTMATMTIATALWWATIANAAPTSLGTGIPWKMLALTAVMLTATSTATAGSIRSARIARHLTRT